MLEDNKKLFATRLTSSVVLLKLEIAIELEGSCLNR
jgi:hypothetical protein